MTVLQAVPMVRADRAALRKRLLEPLVHLFSRSPIRAVGTDDGERDHHGYDDNE